MLHSQEFLASQKQLLLDEKKRLEGDLSHVAVKHADSTDDYEPVPPEYGREEEDYASEEEQFEDEHAVAETMEHHLRDVNAALERIDAGTYGVCTSCNAAIAEDRLKAFPAATTCVDHAA